MDREHFLFGSRTRPKEKVLFFFFYQVRKGHEGVDRGGVLNFELGTDVLPEVSTTTPGPPPYNKTREDANLLPISKPFVS